MEEIDGYTRLLHRIFGIKEPLVCRVCGLGITNSLNGKGKICIDCWREQSSKKQRWYYLQHPDRVQATNKRYALKHLDGVKAWGIAHYLYPETQVCSIEGCNKLAHRHHDDYSKPAQIEWLCALHHKELSKV